MAAETLAGADKISALPVGSAASDAAAHENDEVNQVPFMPGILLSITAQMTTLQSSSHHSPVPSLPRE
jgi:hypothetical protein